MKFEIDNTHNYETRLQFVLIPVLMLCVYILLVNLYDTVCVPHPENLTLLFRFCIIETKYLFNQPFRSW